MPLGDWPRTRIRGTPLSYLGPIPRMVAHQIPVGLCISSTQVFHIGGKAFVQPQVIPPGHRHQVAEPLPGTQMSLLSLTGLVIINSI